MLFQALAIAILMVFYGFYISKIILQKKQSIKTNQMGIGNKPTKILLIEKIMSLATVLTIVIDVCSIFIVKKPPVVQIRIVGLMTGIFAVIFFASTTITMKNSWRVCLLFFNVPLLVVSVWAAVMLHLQILQEENHMKKCLEMTILLI